jgi:phage gp46-like protein
MPMPDAFVVSEAESHSLPADVVRAVELRAEVDALGDLHARRRQLLLTLAPLKALHGHNGIWDDRRKQLLEAMKCKHRIAFAEAGHRATDAAVEANAYADEQYERFLDDGIAARIDYITQQNAMDELNERIRSREIELLVRNAELKMQ